MVMSKIQIRAARTCRGNSELHVIVRTASMAAAIATSFMAQVTNHREIQTALHRLYLQRFNSANIHEYAFNCTVVHNPWLIENVSISRLKLKKKNKKKQLTFTVYAGWSDSFPWMGTKPESITVHCSYTYPDFNKIS
jgi:hypothetical protein